MFWFFNKRSKPRKGAHFGSRSGSPAEVVLCIDRLEDRICPAPLVVVADAPVTNHPTFAEVSTPVAGESASGSLAEFFGAPTMSPVLFDFTQFLDAAGNDAGDVFGVGLDADGKEVAQNIVSGSVGGMLHFRDAVGGDDLGVARVVATAHDTALYVGIGQTGALSSGGLFWNGDPAKASLAAIDPGDSGVLRDALPNGIVTGGNTGASVVGSTDTPVVPLPGEAFGAGLDIEIDSNGLIGIGGSTSRWLSSDTGFQVFATNNLEVPSGALSAATGFEWVLPRAGGGFYWGGEALDANTFLSTVHFWNHEGELVYSGEPGESVVAKASLNDRPIVVFDRAGGDQICDITTGECIDAQSLTGYENILDVFEVNGSAGFVVQTPQGPMTVAYAIETSNPKAVELLVSWGDGSELEVVQTTAGETLLLDHVYDMSGVYNLTVSDGEGATTTEVVVSSHGVITRDGMTQLWIGPENGESVTLTRNRLRVGRESLRFDFSTVDQVVVNGTWARDRFVSFANVDIIVNAGGGDDFVYASGSGNKEIHGGDGRDTLITRGGDSTLYGGDGRDTLIARGGRSLLFGGDGRDTLIASGELSALFGGADRDYLSLRGDGLAVGGEGRDTIIAWGGTTFLSGGVVAADDMEKFTDQVFAEIGSANPTTVGFQGATAGLLFDDDDRDYVFALRGENWIDILGADRYYSSRRATTRVF